MPAKKKGKSKKAGSKKGGKKSSKSSSAKSSPVPPAGESKLVKGDPAPLEYALKPGQKVKTIVKIFQTINVINCNFRLLQIKTKKHDN